MKNIIKTGILCALTFVVGAFSAQARGGNNNSEALAALGGFIGGVIVSEALHDNHQSRKQVVSYRCGSDGYRQSANYNCGYAKHNACGCDGGYWKVVQRRVHVPARYVWRTDNCGRKYRVCIPARYKTIKDRVWVRGHRPGCHFH